MRLYRALCAWLEAAAAAMSEPQEYGPEGAGEARSEFAHDYTAAPELHTGHGRSDDPYEDRHRIGFQANAKS